MTSGSALFDTNILIDLFSGHREAKQALEAWPPQNAISLITWMEVMVGAKKYHQEQRTRMALSTFNIINISQDIAERSVALRQEYKGRCEQVPDMRSSYSSGAHPRGTS